MHTLFQQHFKKKFVLGAIAAPVTTRCTVTRKVDCALRVYKIQSHKQLPSILTIHPMEDSTCIRRMHPHVRRQWQKDSDVLRAHRKLSTETHQKNIGKRVDTGTGGGTKKKSSKIETESAVGKEKVDDNSTIWPLIGENTGIYFYTWTVPWTFGNRYIFNRFCYHGDVVVHRGYIILGATQKNNCTDCIYFILVLRGVAQDIYIYI